MLVHSVEDLPVDQEFLDLAKKNGTIVIPTLTVLDGYVRMYRGVVDRKPPAVDDPNRCIDRATLAKVAETATVDASLVDPARMAAREQRAERFTKVTRANLKTLVNAGIPIATGTDAGNPLTLHGPAIYAEMEAMQASGMTPMQVLVVVDRGRVARDGSRQAGRHDREGQRRRPRHRRRRSVGRRREPAQGPLRRAIGSRATDHGFVGDGALVTGTGRGQRDG